MLAKTIHFYVLWPLSQIFKMIKYFRLIPIMNLVYIIVFTLHIFHFWRGVQIRQQGSVFTSRFRPPGSISASGFGPGGQNLRVQIYGGPHMKRTKCRRHAFSLSLIFIIYQWFLHKWFLILLFSCSAFQHFEIRIIPSCRGGKYSRPRDHWSQKMFLLAERKKGKEEKKEKERKKKRKKEKKKGRKRIERKRNCTNKV